MGRLTASKSGEIASFKTPYATNIKSLKVHFSPKQEGSGDPSPENIREIVGWDGVEGYHSGKNMAHIVGYSAKNSISTSPSDRSLSNRYGTTISTINFLLPDTELIVTQDSYTTEYNANSFRNGYFAVIIDNLIFGKRYNISFKINNIINNPLNVELEDIEICNSKGTEIGNPIVVSNKIIFKNTIWSQNTGAPNRKLIEVRNCGMSFTLSEFMVTPVEDEDFKYESYKGNNISSSWTKNLLDINHSIFTYSGCQRNSDGSITLNSSNGAGWTDDSALVPFALKKGTYTISWRGLTDSDIAAVNLRTSTDGYTNNIRFTNGTGTFTLNEDCNIKFKFSTSIYPVTGYVQLEYGSEPTEYQPYVGTVYGGYVDLVTGELVQEYKLLTLTGDEGITYTPFSTSLYSGSNLFLTDSVSDYRIQGICSMCSSANGKITGNLRKAYENRGIQFYNVTSVWGLSEVTSDALIAKLKEWNLAGTPLQICYKLETPITYQLSPQQLQAFAGQNNFWSNADSIEVSYELIDTPDIQRAKKRIILNQPHIKTVEGDIVSFNTDMRAPLKECKVNFLPIQEGSGDPSPSNIRSIIGWTGINLYKCSRNLVTQDLLINGYYVRGAVTSTGTVIGSIASASAWSCTDFIKVKPSTIYTIFYSWTNASAAGLAYYSDAHIDSAISGISMEQMKNSPYTFTTPFNCHYLRFTSRYQNAFMALVKGEATTIDEIYNGTTIPLDWTDEAGTVYGGYVDLVNGELVATYAILENKWNEYKNNYEMTNVNRRSFLFPYLKYNTGAATDVKCNIAIAQYSLADIVHFYLAKENNNVYMFLPKDLDEETVIQVVAKIAEPIHYSLTPQQILTLKQTNNIYANTNGNIEVKYWKH